MSDKSTTIRTPASRKLSKQKKAKAQKNIFLRDIEVDAIKEVLLTEIDMPKLRDSLIEDIKAALLKDIDISGIKEALVKEIAVKDLIGRKKNTGIETAKSEEPIVKKKKKVNLPGYKYGLVDNFLKSHQEILSVYEAIMENAKNKDYAILPLMLSQFSKKCFDHFEEEEELYTFMKALAGSRSDIECRIANEFSTEMKNLSRELFTILNQSHYIPVNDKTVNGFTEEFQQLGAVLQERITREEAVLYPMYENSRQVVDIC